MDAMQAHFADGATPVFHHETPHVSFDLMTCVLQFNQVVAEGLHPSWLAADEVFWRDHVHAFKQMESRLRVSNWLRDHFKLNDCYDDQFQSREKRVYLIPAQPFQQLTLCLGASFCVSALRKQLMRSQVMNLREALGEGIVRQLFSSFHDGYDAGVDVLAPSDALHADKLYAMGAQALLAGAQTHGEAVLRRTQLKLRRECAEVDEILIHVRDTALLYEHVMIIAMLFIPGWNSLFALADEGMAA
jgi:hypothetical protein